MAELKKTKQGYKLVWQDSLIFPDLESDDKISVTTSKAERGEILDRDGKIVLFRQLYYMMFHTKA